MVISWPLFLSSLAKCFKEVRRGNDLTKSILMMHFRCSDKIFVYTIYYIIYLFPTHIRINRKRQDLFPYTLSYGQVPILMPESLFEKSA